MATNRGNSDGNVNYSPNIDRNMGITGNIKNRMARENYRQDLYRENTGYLSVSKKELDTILNNYKEIAKTVEKMSKVDQNRFRKAEESMKEELKTLEYIRDAKEVDAEESMRAVKSANKAAINGAKEYLRLMKMIVEEQNSGDKDHKKEIDQIADYYEEIRQNASKTNKDMNTTAKTLKNTASETSKAWANTLNGIGDKISNISNMLNLSAIANNTAEQALRSKFAVQNSIMKQFGMTSSSQYNQFKQSALDTVWQMNSSMKNMFNTDDMYSYFQNLTELGITNQKIAQEQLKYSLMGSKYLGVSIDTQQQIFKYMKRTNDYTALQNHNKTVVGLLKSQLGVSREQLDELANIAYTTANDLAASGMSKEAQSAFVDMSQIAGTAALGQGIDLNTVKSMQNLYSTFLNTDVEHLGDWAPILRGVNLLDLRDTGFNATTTEGALNNYARFIQALENSGLLSSNPNDRNYIDVLRSLAPNIDTASILGYKNLDLSRMMADSTDLVNGIGQIDERMTEEYIQETNELTALEKIENFTSFAKDTIESWNRGIFNLANMALVAYLAAKPFELYGFIKDLKLTSLLTDKLGLGSGIASGMGKVAAGAAIVGLTAAAISALAGAVERERKDTYERNYSKNLESLNGTVLQGNESYASATTMTDSSKSVSWIGNVFGGIEQAFKRSKTDLVSKDPYSRNKALAKELYESGKFNDTDKNMAFAMLMDYAGNLDALNEALGTSYSRNDLKKYYWKTLLDKGDATSIWDNVRYWIEQKGSGGYGSNGKPITNSAKVAEWLNKVYLQDVDNSELIAFEKSYDGYKKAGLNWVPKDNYKALLHKGEMVLNERQANAYRSMYGMGGEADSLAALIKSPWIKITSMWGNRPNPFGGGNIENHGGVDIAAPEGTPVGSPVAGTINSIGTGYGGGFGNSVYIVGKNGMNYILAHFVKPPSVSSGASVSQGQLVGYVGSTGRSTGNHLHFQVNKSGTWNKAGTVNPVPYLNSSVLFPGTISETLASSGDLISANSETPTPTTGRFINGASSIYSNAMGGAEMDEGASKIVSSVDGGFNKLIAYLDSISKRQNEQQILLEAFSKSRASGKDF